MFATMRIAILLIAGVCAAVACSSSSAPKPLSPLKSAQIVSGSGQTGHVGLVLPESIVVVATDSNGQPAVGAVLVYGPSGNGGVTSASNLTNSSGRAAAAWQLDPNASADTLQIAVQDPHNQNNIVMLNVYATATQ